MVLLKFMFNGKAQIQLDPQNEEDRQLLQLAFNGREVKSIKPTTEGGIVLEMAKSEERTA